MWWTIIQVCRPQGRRSGNKKILTFNNPCQGGRGADADNSSQEPRMIGDFEGSANALWTLYGKEAKSHDEARIQTLKDDMDGVLIFVCPYLLVPNGHSHADA